MTTYTKLIFGVHSENEVLLTVRADGGVGPTPPPLLLMTYGNPSQAAISCSNSTWTTKLAAGDHIVRIEADDIQWFLGTVSIELSSRSTLVSRPQSDGAIVAWSATRAATVAPSSSSDPKNPWPPPEETAIATLADTNWLATTLSEMTTDIVRTARVKPPLRDPAHAG